MQTLQGKKTSKRGCVFLKGLYLKKEPFFDLQNNIMHVDRDTNNTDGTSHVAAFTFEPFHLNS